MQGWDEGPVVSLDDWTSAAAEQIVIASVVSEAEVMETGANP